MVVYTPQLFLQNKPL